MYGYENEPPVWVFGKVAFCIMPWSWVVASFRVRAIVVVAGAAGGAAVLAFVLLAGAWDYTAEVSGQVVVGTTVFALAQKLADAVLVWRHLRALRRRLATLIDDYVRDAQLGPPKPRSESVRRARAKAIGPFPLQPSLVARPHEKTRAPTPITPNSPATGISSRRSILC